MALANKDHDEQLNHLFEPLTIMPTQYFTALRRRAARHGEKRLMIAILEDAVAVYLGHREPTTSKRRRLFRDTERWLTWSVANGHYEARGNPDEERRRFGVPAEAIGTFLDGLDERYGGVRGYLGSLGLSEDVFVAIRRNLLATESSATASDALPAR